jgi:hypothetical protein
MNGELISTKHTESTIGIFDSVFIDHVSRHMIRTCRRQQRLFEGPLTPCKRLPNCKPSNVLVMARYGFRVANPARVIVTYGYLTSKDQDYLPRGMYVWE